MDPTNPMDDLEKARHLDTRSEFAALEAELKALTPSREPDTDHARRSEHMAIERLLSDLAPTAPSDLLRERITQSLAEEETVPMQTRTGGFPWLPVFAAVAAVAVAALTLFGMGVFTNGDAPLVADSGLTVQATGPVTPGGADADAPKFDPEFDAIAGIKRYTPVSANRYLVGARHGVRDVGELGPMRVTVVRTMDEVEYKHPEKNRRVIISRPSDKLLLRNLEGY